MKKKCVNCLEFTQSHVGWSKVLWSDESSFEIGHLSKQMTVWHQEEEKYQLDCLQPTFKSGQTLLMVWGAFFGTVKAPLIFLPPKQRKATDLIKNVYKDGLVPFLSKQDPNLELILMEDNAPVHTAIISQNF